jgi:nucleoside-diphosphate-sugar epimerase
MLVALTGATGFVGGHALRELLARGHKVRVLVRDKARLAEEFRDRTDVVTGGLESTTAVDELVSGADVVLHLAGVIKALNRPEFMAVNAHGAEHLAQAALQAGVGRFVLVSSLAARERDISDYAASKAIGEDRVKEVYAGADKGEVVIVRPPAVYGPGDEATLPLIRELTKRMTLMTGTSAQRLSLIHAEDLAGALAAAVEGAGVANATYELDDGTEGGYTHSDLAQAVKPVTGKAPVMLHIPRAVLWLAALGCEGWMALSRKAVILNRGKVRELYHDDWVSAGARFDETGAWTPRLNFEQGFARTLSWYRDNGWLPAA